MDIKKQYLKAIGYQILKHGILRKMTKFLNFSTKTDKEQIQIACHEFISCVKVFINPGIQNIYISIYI